MIAALPSPVEREIYGNRAANHAGVSHETMAAEVEKARKGQSRRTRRQEERQALTPANNCQPKERDLRYDNVRSARAEEGVLRLMLLDPELFHKAQELEPEHFSAPLLGKVYRLLRERWRQGSQVHLAALAGELTGEEMSHVAALTDQPESLAHGEQALTDYIKLIETEYLKRSGGSERDLLLAARQRYKEKKSYGGEENEHKEERRPRR
jgi:DNA primase